MAYVCEVPINENNEIEQNFYHGAKGTYRPGIRR